MAKKPIWTEDECTRHTEGHEYLAQAWKRIFGTNYDPKQAIKVVDHGDCIERQFLGGISTWNIYGAWDEICYTEKT